MPRPKINPHKKKFNVYLDERIVNQAKELGLNISKICENSLKNYISALEEAGVST